MSLEAEESSLSFDLLTKIEENKQIIKIVLTALILGIAATIVVRWYMKSVEIEASHAVVGAGIVPARSTNEVPADTWLKVAAQHSGTQAGRRALLLAASKLFQDGRYSDAEAKFDALIAEGSTDSLLPSAAYGKAACLDAQNKLQEAAAAYQNVISRFKDAPVYELARMGRARIHEASNQPEQALAIYDEMTKSTSATAGNAAGRREALLIKFPNLSKPQSGTNTINVVPASGAPAK